MPTLEKRIATLEQASHSDTKGVMFLHFVGLDSSGSNEWVRRYSCGSQVFERMDHEPLQDFQRRVESNAARPAPTNFLIAKAFQSPGEPMAK